MSLEQPHFFLGVDGGATKTHAAILNEEGRIAGFGEGGCGSHEAIGYERAQVEIRNAISNALEAAKLSLSQISNASFCLAGVDIHADMVQIPIQMLDPIMDSVPYVLRNDAFGCLRGGTRASHGVMINCGTGQVAVGRNRQGEEIRVGGYGFEYGDFAGGTVIAHASVAAIVRASDGRGPETSLTRLILEKAGAPSVPEFLEACYRDHEYLLSLSIPRLTFQASKNGDAVARKIILDIADEMSVTAIALIKRLRMEQDQFDLVLAGSVFKGEDPAFLESIRSHVHAIAPGANFTLPVYPPVIGAALLAYESIFPEVSDSVYEEIEKTLQGYI